jgi:hypothetical protein
MIQQVVVVLIFIFAVAYLGRLVYRSITVKSDCTTGCGKCSVDFKKLENDLQNKGI